MSEGGGLAMLFIFVVLPFLGFIGFFIYFVFKILQFVIQAINLYKKILNREDAILKVLIDIRDNTKQFSETDSPASSNRNCPSCDAVLSDSDVFCPECGKEL
ncbi:MAG TPA: zinc ribbon domain-containing protein [Syntrophorhabdaceae bacterium]|nr:zinc ribbon domain-containing protein [Syntrophorhabdaceae bacterium]